MLELESVDPALLRRNICVSGINLLALKNKQFMIGNTLLEYTGLCHPCSFMEETFGAGGYNAIRGHGGITAHVVKSGLIKMDDKVNSILTNDTPPPF
jgi:MOSC domain-containing protein YiiM